MAMHSVLKCKGQSCSRQKHCWTTGNACDFV